MQQPNETSVLIAGAGPVGLALACELGLRGIDCVIAERRDGTITLPKMSLISAGTMEYCRRWGIAKAVRTAVWSEQHALDFVYMATLAGPELARIKVPAYADSRPSWTPEGMCQCPQIYFDPILAARVAELACVRRLDNTSVESFEQHETGVAVTLRGSDGATQTINARYLVGCDGAGSTVREALGIELDGEGGIANSVNIFFRAPTLARQHAKGWARIYRPIDQQGCWAELIPIDGDQLWRLTVFDDVSYVDDPTAALTRMAGFAFPHEVLSTLLWERRDSVAAHYQRGRVLLAGDSAHQSSPTGGVGMHTGMEEAVNLAWKLEAMLNGWGGPRLLASYDAERRPIAHRNVKLSTETFRALRAIPPLAELDHTTDWQRDMSIYSVADHVRTCPYFAASPVCVDDGTPPLSPVPPTPVASARPGARAPHAWLPDGRSTLDLFGGGGFVLVRLGEDPPSGRPLIDAAAQRHVPHAQVHIEDPQIAALYEQPLVLVRPDFHVAWRGAAAPDDPLAVIDHVRGG